MSVQLTRYYDTGQSLRCRTHIVSPLAVTLATRGTRRTRDKGGRIGASANEQRGIAALVELHRTRLDGSVNYDGVSPCSNANGSGTTQRLQKPTSSVAPRREIVAPDEKVLALVRFFLIIKGRGGENNAAKDPFAQDIGAAVAESTALSWKEQSRKLSDTYGNNLGQRTETMVVSHLDLLRSCRWGPDLPETNSSC